MNPLLNPTTVPSRFTDLKSVLELRYFEGGMGDGSLSTQLPEPT